MRFGHGNDFQSVACEVLLGVLIEMILQFEP
jgi:hypothetical protein